MAKKYIYDDKQVRFRVSKNPVSGILLRLLKYFVFSIAVAVVCYGLFALIFSTDQEHRLRQENRIYAKVYPEIEKKERLLSDVVTGLKLRDDEIYSEIFHTQAPDAERLFAADFLAVSDTTADEAIAAFVEDKADVLMKRSSRIEENFRAIFDGLSAEGFVMPPMSMPIKGFSYAQTGATVGQKLSPFYKVKVEHHGLDMIVHVGTPVYATGPGVVTDVIRSGRGQGNIVEITHDGGYMTRYSHLQDITVAKGRKVDTDVVIGHTGMSGMAYAPHLHYEVYRDGNVLDPVDYFFHDVTPYEYADIVIMSVSVEQSMD
ncbi:MAG: M23 family metallopeptidase [Clostridium sp.]|nr:M23 family metallopeptidase [Bacteroides sp.]MCM1198306.1 M23 family metallopeptidase [Clostridium sp.]